MEVCEHTLEEYLQGRQEISHLVPWEIAGQQPGFVIDISRIATDIVNGLIFIHAQGKVHRDLTPHNGMYYSLPITNILRSYFHPRR